MSSFLPTVCPAEGHLENLTADSYRNKDVAFSLDVLRKCAEDLTNGKTNTTTASATLMSAFTRYCSEFSTTSSNHTLAKWSRAHRVKERFWARCRSEFWILRRPEDNIVTGSLRIQESTPTPPGVWRYLPRSAVLLRDMHTALCPRKGCRLKSHDEIADTRTVAKQIPA
ncbi:hypothetical protein DFS34DRAFT_589019 [Phlyctochytrium arcticum]|nr:hypothetical protein DFS34DRAFT_589019 [Phlyctochytrium arcticum]